MNRFRRFAAFPMCLTLLLAMASVARSQRTESAKVTSPQVDPDGKVTFRLLAASAKDVKVKGDYIPADGAQMTKDDRGVWSFSMQFKPGIYGYYFMVEGQRFIDPSNLYASHGAKLLKSYVEVPEAGGGFWAIKDVPHGALHEHFYKSPTLGTTRRVIVYTPPGYDPNAEKSYPVLYLCHGAGDDEGYWTRVGRANFIMDNLLAEGKTKPALIVMPFGHTSVPPPADEGGVGGKELYEVSAIEKDLLECVIPLVEREYRVGKDAKDRAISGMSMGGYHAATIGLNNSHVFGYVVPLSSGIRANQNLEQNFKALLADKAKALKQLKKVWIIIGSADNGVDANKRMADFLAKSGIPNQYDLIEGGTHTWLSWRGYLRDMMPKLFND